MSARAFASRTDSSLNPPGPRAPDRSPSHSGGFELTCVPGAPARRSGSVRSGCSGSPGAAAAARRGSSASSSSSPAPPAAASPSFCRTRLPGVSSCCSRSCGSAAQLLPLSGGGQLGDAPATAPALRIRRRHAPNKTEASPRGKIRGGVDPLPWHEASARRQSPTGAGAEAARGAPCSCCSHLPNSKIRTLQRTDTPTGRSHWPARCAGSQLIGGCGCRRCGERDLCPPQRPPREN